MRLISCVAACLMALVVSGCGDSPTSPTANVPFSTVDLTVGTGAEATAGRNVTVNYSGFLYSATATGNKGTPFDAGQFAFTVGTGVITGFSQGVTGMRVGGSRRVIIPPNLGYGNQANGSIPANSTLVFEIELLAVR